MAHKNQSSEFSKACELLQACIGTLSCGCSVDDPVSCDFLAFICKDYIKVYERYEEEYDSIENPLNPKFYD